MPLSWRVAQGRHDVPVGSWNLKMYQLLAGELREHRRDRQLLMGEVAAGVGCSATTVLTLENGTANLETYKRYFGAVWEWIDAHGR